MAKIINVDFKKKKLEYTWTDNQEEKILLVEKTHKRLMTILDTIIYITEDDKEYQEYVAKQLGLIMYNLRGRI